MLSVNCKKLSNVYCYSTYVPSTHSEAFKDSYIEYAVLHVPENSINIYKSRNPWSNFGKIIALTDDDTGINDVKTNREVTASYLLNGQKTEGKKQGIYIMRMNDGTIRKILVK